MAFLDKRFPPNVAAGVTGGPATRVDIVTLSSGHEERNARWKHFRRSYDAGLGIEDSDTLGEVLDFFKETGGPLHSFRFKDWSDFSSARPIKEGPRHTDQTLGTGDGSQTEFQLVKLYGGLAPYTRPITKPMPGTVIIGLDGVNQTTGWSVDHLTGLVTFTAPPAPGAEITAGFLFDVPVRFDTQEIQVEMTFFSNTKGDGLGHAPDIPLIEVRE